MAHHEQKREQVMYTASPAEAAVPPASAQEEESDEREHAAGGSSQKHTAATSKSAAQQHTPRNDDTGTAAANATAPADIDPAPAPTTSAGSPPGMAQQSATPITAFSATAGHHHHSITNHHHHNTTTHHHYHQRQLVGSTHRTSALLYNLPPQTSESELMRLLQQFGPVADITLSTREEESTTAQLEQQHAGAAQESAATKAESGSAPHQHRQQTTPQGGAPSHEHKTERDRRATAQEEANIPNNRCSSSSRGVVPQQQEEQENGDAEPGASKALPAPRQAPLIHQQALVTFVYAQSAEHIMHPSVKLALRGYAIHASVPRDDTRGLPRNYLKEQSSWSAGNKVSRFAHQQHHFQRHLTPGRTGRRPGGHGHSASAAIGGGVHGRSGSSDPDAVVVEEAMKTTKQVFVGGIPPVVTQPQFREYFSQFGNLTEAILMVDLLTNRNRGFGFVTYSARAEAQSVIDHDGGHILGGRCVDCKYAFPRSLKSYCDVGNKAHPSSSGANNPESNGSAVDTTAGSVGEDNPADSGGVEQRFDRSQDTAHFAGKTRQIFVGGLAHHTTKADLESHFSQFGCVAEVLLMVNAMSGRGRGFGFVMYESVESLDKCCAVKDHVVCGKRVDVGPAYPKGVRAPDAKSVPYRTGPVPAGFRSRRGNRNVPGGMYHGGTGMHIGGGGFMSDPMASVPHGVPVAPFAIDSNGTPIQLAHAAYYPYASVGGIHSLPVEGTVSPAAAASGSGRTRVARAASGSSQTPRGAKEGYSLAGNYMAVADAVTPGVIGGMYSVAGSPWVGNRMVPGIAVRQGHTTVVHGDVDDGWGQSPMVVPAMGPVGMVQPAGVVGMMMRNGEFVPHMPVVPVMPMVGMHAMQPSSGAVSGNSAAAGATGHQEAYVARVPGQSGRKHEGGGDNAGT